MTEAVGSIADEAAKLVAAVEDWWRDRVGGGEADEPTHTGPECVVCPVCQVLAMLRSARPEVFEHLAAASAALFAALKSAVDGSDRPRRHSEPAQRIDIG